MKIERVSEEEERELAMMKDAQKTRAVVEGGDDAGRPRAVAVADALTRYAVGGGASRQTGVTLRARRNAHAVKSRFCNAIGVGVTASVGWRRYRSAISPIWRYGPPLHDWHCQILINAFLVKNRGISPRMKTPRTLRRPLPGIEPATYRSLWNSE